MTILVYEPICRGLEHAQFNASILGVLAAAYPTETVTFLAEELHIREVRSALSGAISPFIQYDTLDVPARDMKPICRFRFDLKNAFRVLSMSRKISASLIVMTSSRESVLFSLAIASHTYARNSARRWAIIHMEMRKIRLRSKNPVMRCFDFVASLRYAAATGVRYWTLEEAIKKQAELVLPDAKKWLRVLPHPIVQRRHVVQEPEGPNIKLGFLGLATPKKGFDVFTRIAESTKTYGTLSFHVIGTPAGTECMPDSSLFAEGPFEKRLSIKRYEELIAGLDYICVFLDSDRYRYSASGTLLDALSFQKPIIALNIPIIEDLCTRYGDIGHICNDEEEVQSVLLGLSSGIDAERYLSQAENLRNLVRDRSPEVLASILKAEVASAASP